MADGVLKKGVDSGALTLEALFQPTVAIDDGAGYHQAGMGGVDFRVALLEDECHWQFTPWVKS